MSSPDATSLATTRTTRSSSSSSTFRRRPVSFGNPSLEAYQGTVYTTRNQDETVVIEGALSIPKNEAWVALNDVPPEQVPEGVLHLIRSHQPWIRHLRIVIAENPGKPGVTSIPQQSAMAESAATLMAATEETQHVPEEERSYIVLMEVTTPDEAEQLVQDLDGQPYTSLDETQVGKFEHIIAWDGPESMHAPLFAANHSPRGELVSHNCAVCLESMDHEDDERDAEEDEAHTIVTTVCNHTFHLQCLAQCQGSPCPVCRYDHSGLNNESLFSKCNICGTTEHNYVCLICGTVSCGGRPVAHAAARSPPPPPPPPPGDATVCASVAVPNAAQGNEMGAMEEGPQSHARQHYVESLHAYALEAETQHVWDFCGQGYVHRLLQNKDDGKLVEIPDPSNTSSQERSSQPGLSSTQEEVVVHRKLESLASAYYSLLKSQLQAQRIHYEERLTELRRDESNRKRRMARDWVAALKQERQQLSQRLGLLQSRRDKAREDVKFLKSMNESLQANKEAWPARVRQAQEERTSVRKMFEECLPPLQEKVTRLMLQLESSGGWGNGIGGDNDDDVTANWSRRTFLPTFGRMCRTSTVNIVSHSQAVRARRMMIRSTKAIVVTTLFGNVFALKQSNDARELVIGGGGLDDEYFRFFTKLESAKGTCGASLIAPELLLTAAHCSLPELAQVGYYSASDIQQIINISDSFDHPAFNPINLFYDFKVVKLASPAATNATIVPLNSNNSFPTDRETLIVMGVGDTDSTPTLGNAPDFAVQGSIVRIENKNDCEDARGLSASYADSIFESMLCTFQTPGTIPSNGASNACNEDNGGPLLAADYNIQRPASDVGVQVGVVSWGYDSCYNGNRFPRVYARVSDGYEWIRFIVCRESAIPPASFDCSGNMTQPAVPNSPRAPPTVNSIKFRYTFTTNFFPYENGVRVEDVTRVFPRTFQHVVPAALPTNAVFTQTMNISRGDLYAFTIVDTTGNGIQPPSAPIKLEMEQSDGTFKNIMTIQPDFGKAAVAFFYATADGTVADPFDAPNSFPENKFLTLNLALDDYPEEVSIVLFSGTQEIWFRPYRFYTNQPREQITERIPIPNELRNYTLTIRDSRFDGVVSGIDETNYTLSYYDVVLVDDVFETSGVSSNTFSFDPRVYDTENPTSLPTAPPTFSPSSSPSTRIGYICLLSSVTIFSLW